MSGGNVIGPRSTGLVGKLPTHGDFLRRGDDPALLARLDHWLDTELGRAEPMGLAERLETMPAWRFMVAEHGGALLGALVASHDRVGRSFPLLGFVQITAPIDANTAVRCCELVKNTLLAAVSHDLDVAGGLATLDAIVCGDGDGEQLTTGRWWHEDDAFESDALPTGASFDRLLGSVLADPKEVQR